MRSFERWQRDVSQTVCVESPLLLVPGAALSAASHASKEEGFHPRNSDPMRQCFSYEGVHLDRLVLRVCLQLVMNHGE